MLGQCKQERVENEEILRSLKKVEICGKTDIIQELISNIYKFAFSLIGLDDRSVPMFHKIKWNIDFNKSHSHTDAPRAAQDYVKQYISRIVMGMQFKAKIFLKLIGKIITEENKNSLAGDHNNDVGFAIDYDKKFKYSKCSSALSEAIHFTNFLLNRCHIKSFVIVSLSSQ